MKLKNQTSLYILVFLVFTGLWAFTSNNPFFWDTIQLASAHAHYFYKTNFQSIILPNAIDSGHIPAFGFYIAFAWEIFGKTLLVSHLAMLPFVLGIVFQTKKLTQKIFSKEWQMGALFIILLDATLLAQCTLVSPDVLLVFFFLMGLNHFISNKKFWFSIALSGLVLTSMRGMMCMAGFFVTQFTIRCIQSGIFSKKVKSNEKIKYLFSLQPFGNIPRIIAYIPASLIAVAFFSWHYIQTGWIGYHEGMPWSGLFAMVDFTGFIKNLFIVGWRLIDFGRLFIWLAALLCLIDYYKRRPVLNPIFINVGILFICLFLFLGQAALLHKGLSGQRYLLPIYLTFALLVSYYLLEHYNKNRWKRPLLLIIVVGMLSGNCWVYSDKIAKGWDSTLAYLPYFQLRAQMMTYMKSNNITYEETGSEFPNVSKFELTDLSENQGSFARKDLSLNKYIFYSNVFNDFKDEEIDQLNSQWRKIKEYKFLQVKVVLYKKP